MSDASKPKALFVTLPSGRKVKVRDHGEIVSAGLLRPGESELEDEIKDEILSAGLGYWGDEMPQEAKDELDRVTLALEAVRQARKGAKTSRTNTNNAKGPRPKRTPSYAELQTFVETLSEYDVSNPWPRGWRKEAAKRFHCALGTLSRIKAKGPKSESSP